MKDRGCRGPRARTRGADRADPDLLRSSERSTPSAARQLAWVPLTAVRVSHSLPNRHAAHVCRQGVVHVNRIVCRSRCLAHRRQRALAAGDHRAVRDPARRDRRCNRRTRRDRQVAHRVGQDARLRDPAGRAASAAEGPRPAGLVLAPTRELATQIVDEHPRRSRMPARCASPRSTAASDWSSRPRTPPHRTCWSRPQGGSRICSRVARSRWTTSGCWFSTRPTGCSTWAFVRRSTGSSPPARRKRQTLFFSATLDGEAGRHRRPLRARPGDPRAGPDRRGAPAPRSSTGSCEVAHEHRVEALVERARSERDLTLVFVRTKHGADRLVKRLRAHGVEAVAMHGNKSQRQREQALARFESGAVDTLVATDVAARGIDVAGSPT